MLKLEDFYCANPEPGSCDEMPEPRGRVSEVSECIHGDNREQKASVGGGPSYSREA